MTTNPKVIGEGAYGCVHKPALHCSNQLPNFNYDDYVSKLMIVENAKDELSEFVIIDKIDPKDEFHLGNPVLCEPKIDKESSKNIGKCKDLKIKNVVSRPNDYRLLLLKYGGYDLANFCKHHLSQMDKNKVHPFLLEIRQLLKGLQAFKNNGLVHNDIKPQNILFNPENGQLRFIDFGLMKTKKQITNLSKDNDNDLAVFHWSFPLECGFMNYNVFNKYKNMDNNKKKELEIYFSNTLVKVTRRDIDFSFLILFLISDPNAFDIVFSYLSHNLEVPSNNVKQGYLDSFFLGFNEMGNGSYSNFLGKTIDSIDIYGLGISLQYVINHFNHKNMLELNEYMQLSSFFSKMYDFNCETRVRDIDLLLKEYDIIMLELGINSSNKTPSVTTRSSPLLSKSKPLSISLQKIAYEDPITISQSQGINGLGLKRCPEDKELNPKTKRCVKKCENGFIRNSEFKCRKGKTKKAMNVKSIRSTRIKSKSRSKSRSKSKATKLCPKDKDLNPKTKRCVKKCEDGFTRNSEFRCRKTVRNKNKL